MHQSVDVNQKPRLQMQLKVELVDQWKALVGGVDKDYIPVAYVKKVLFKLKSGKRQSINLVKLRREGVDVEDIEHIISKKMTTLNNEIANMEFVIDIDAVAEHVQPLTNINIREPMKVRLVSYSQPTDEFLSEGLDDVQDLVAYCARVSNPANQNNTETSEKLLNYLAKHKHWSPFEMVSACLEIETTRDIARQMLRHRSFSFQEFSQRYANPGDMGDMFELREARLQDEKNRQNSVETDSVELQREWDRHQRRVLWMCKEVYDWALQHGIAKEQARAVLPEGLTKSRMYMNGTLRSWIHYIELRGANGTQKEHMEIAHAIAQVIAEIFPSAKNYIS
jgi:thymidylate synthase (FAD)